jgi:hypothetical protein
MKRSIGLFLLLSLSGLQPSAQNPARGSSAAAINAFLIDQSKPYMYLQLDHIGPSYRYPLAPLEIYMIGVNASNAEAGQATQTVEQKPNQDIYLRLRNNCRIPIVVFTARLYHLDQERTSPPSGPHPEALSLVMDRVEWNPQIQVWDDDRVLRPTYEVPVFVAPSVPLLLGTPGVLLSPELRKAKAQLQAEEEKRTQGEIARKEAEIAEKKAREEAETKELYELLTRDLSYFSDETTVPPGMEIYFSVPIDHVNRKWHFAIPFQLVTNSREPIQEPYGYAMFYWYDLPKAYRKGL